MIRDCSAAQSDLIRITWPIYARSSPARTSDLEGQAVRLADTCSYRVTRAVASARLWVQKV